MACSIQDYDEAKEIQCYLGGCQKIVQLQNQDQHDVLVKTEDRKEETTRKVGNTPSGDRENIIVAGSPGTDFVEVFNWRQRTWSPLQSMPKNRHGATSFVYHNHVTITGGYGPGIVNDDMIRMNIHPNPDLDMQWSNSPVKLPTKLAHHSSVLFNDHLMISGGHDGNAVSDCIYDVELVPPYTVKTLSRMPEPRQFHSMQVFDDSLLIVGGRPTEKYQDNLSSVVMYDVKKNEWKQLAPLPYKVSKMATVKWGDNIVVIGGADNHRNTLDKVLIYNVKTQQHHYLPSMNYKRRDCTAVVVGNNIVALGGNDERWRATKSVAVFNFESYNWQELPDMLVARFWHTAIVV